MKLCSLFSGGKDSMMALYQAMKGHQVEILLAMISKSKESYMFHTPAIKLTRYSAKAIGIPLIQKATSGIPPQEDIDLENVIRNIKKKFEIEGIVAGAVESNYQFQRIEKICKKLGLELIAPYWQKSHLDLIQNALEAGFEILIVGVAAHGLGEEWLGRTLDKNALEELISLNKKFGIHIGGEGGEYETLVVDGPIFKKRIEILESKKEWDGLRGELLIEKVVLR